ncbi:MAG: bi-domain-containing oxidoreductase [Planctomycetaceae bacterium]
MKQVLYRQGRAFVEKVPAPRVEPGSVLVRVDHSAISVGTEMHGIRTSAVPLWKRAIKNPQLIKRAYSFAKNQGMGKTRRLLQEKANAVQPLGYSTSGIILETGEDVREFQPGDRVACAGNQSAYHAEAVCSPLNLTVPVPEEVPLAEASTVALGAIALQGVRRLEPTLGETFVVVGLGFLGQLISQMLRAHGCRAIGVDVDHSRLSLAEQLGMSAGIHPDDELDFQQVIRLTDGVGADGVIIAAATPSNAVISHAFKMCRRKGRVVLVGDVGLDINRGDMYEKELDFRISTSYGPGRYDAKYEEHGIDYPVGYVRWTENRNMAEYLRLLAEKRVQLSPLISATVPVAEAATAYEELRSGKSRPLMILIQYPQAEEADVDETSPFITYTPTSQETSGLIGLAIIGPGSFTRETHLPNLQKLADRFQIRTVVARSGHNAATIAKRCGANCATTDFESVLKDRSIDALLIATRHNQHAKMTLQALQAGKHVLVEKPLALTENELAQIEEFYDSWTQREPKSPPMLMTGFNRRFAPVMDRVQQIISRRSNPMIINYTMNAGYIPSDHWVHGPEGGGRNRGEACHIYDLFTALTNSQVTNLSATPIQPTTEHYRRDDNFVVSIAFADGSVANLTYTALGHSDGPKEHMRIFVDGKIIDMTDYHGLNVTGLPGKQDRKSRFGRAAEKGHLQELEAFANVIQQGGEWPIPLWQQVQATEISFAVERFLNGRVHAIPQDEFREG